MSRSMIASIRAAALAMSTAAGVACSTDSPVEPPTTPPSQPTPPAPPSLPTPDRAVASVELDATSIAVEEGATRQLVATPRNARGEPITGLAVAWMSSDAGVAQVGVLGQVTGVRGGAATLTASVSGKSAQAVVAVSASYAYDLLYEQRTFDLYRELFRIDVRTAGASSARLFATGQWAKQARVSPDGKRIAYVCPNPIIGDDAICVASRDGSGSAMIAAFIGEGFDQPTWSADGSRIAFVRTRNEDGVDRSHLWVVNADGTGLAPLTADAPGDQTMPAWSPRLPDGTERIAYVQDVNLSPRIWTMRVGGSDRRRLGADADVRDIQPAWSPDGRTIAFQRTSPSGSGDLWLINADGTEERALMPMLALAGPQLWPTWSPDGRLIAFTSSHESVGGAGVYQVYTVWADGTKLARRTFDAGDKAAPSWLPRSE